MDRRTGNSRKLKQRKKKVFSRVMHMKLIFSLCVILALLLFLLGRIIFIYEKYGNKYSNAVLRHLTYSGGRVPYERGDITDRNGAVLATSRAIYNVVLDPSVVYSNKKGEFITPTLNALVKIFGVDYQKVAADMDSDHEAQYLVVFKGASYEAVQEFKKLQEEDDNIKGVWFEQEYQRVYPNDKLASHVLGYTNAGNVGTYGIEQYYNDYLNGTDGRSYGYYDNELNIVETKINAKNGATVVSTIDSFAQAVVEDEIAKFKAQYKVSNIGIILMDPNSGSVYAMGSNSEFNLNDPRDLTACYSQSQIDAMNDQDKSDALNKMWRNFCISDTYEPGSTYKLVTVSAALEEGTSTPSSTYVCNGYKSVGDYNIYCANTSGHGQLTLAESVEYSCNVCLMEIGEAMGKDIFLKYQNLFNFGNSTGIDLPGEADGILIPYDNMNEAELATSTFGQSFNVSMIQMASAFSSIVNGGKYYKPHVVSQVVSEDGVELYSAKDTLMRLTVSEETSKFMRDTVRLVVEEGTGGAAAVEGYKVGGKTGTAEKSDRNKRNYVVSFISCVPVESPRLVCYVVIDEIDDPVNYNSSRMAAELTSKVLGRVLPHLGIYPESGEINYHVGEFMDEIGAKNKKVDEETSTTETTTTEDDEEDGDTEDGENENGETEDDEEGNGDTEEGNGDTEDGGRENGNRSRSENDNSDDEEDEEDGEDEEYGEDEDYE